jgi:hypothetical protein
MCRYGTTVELSACGWCFTINSQADPTSAAAAAKDGTRKLPPRSKVIPSESRSDHLAKGK